MRIILSRHGNTFSTGAKAIWIGGRADPPLVLEGERQAWRLGIALRRARRIPSAVFCSPLRRTNTFAEIALATSGARRSPVPDWRLSEIDYGDWEGLSNIEVVRRFGGRVFFDWYRRSIWPISNWKTDQNVYVDAIDRFLLDLRRCCGSTETILVVTAHGPLKCIGRRLMGGFGDFPAAQLARVDTGNICELEMGDTFLRPVTWNERPDVLLPPAWPK
ncbi:histidine phosphatase family protein [Mesorhizobium sp.]|uniref:histidine phosphatase family protein n=1 Tax=Mesorhizobium sp. TaxID=1871066 RepID=UPI000FE6C7E4|nr:MAG: histidine phosphatase family protein [Mesorhizobium sp.]